MSSSWFDLSSIVGLQRSIISDLSGNSAVINHLDLSLNNLNTALSAANTNVLPTLTYQNDVNDILERENTRLGERKQAIDIAEMGQKRMIDLTNSATMQKQAINNIYVIVVVALLIYLGIKMLSNILPEFVTDIMTIVLISITIIIIAKRYSDYNRRNKMNYNIIDFEDPSQTGNSYAVSSSISSNMLDLRFNGCIKDACCSEGTIFNDKYSICVPNLPPVNGNALANSSEYPNFKYFIASKSWLDPTTCSNGYSLDDLSCNATKQGFATMKTANHNGPNEFVDYNLYK